MDCECDPEEPPVTFDNPELPFTCAHGSELFGESVDYDMLGAEDMTPWSWEKPGYTNDAHTDGRIDDQLHPPNYYAYSPHTDSWEDGLQEIEDFDWLADKEDEQYAGEQESNVQEEQDIQVADGAETLRPTDQDDDHDLVENDTIQFSVRADAPTIQSENKIPLPKELTTCNDTAYISEVSEISTLRSPIKQVGSGSFVIDDQHAEAEDAMGNDDASVVAYTGRSEIRLEIESGVSAEQGPCARSEAPAFQDRPVTGDMIAKKENSAGLDDTDVVKESTSTCAPAFPNYDDLLIHESDSEIPTQVVTAPETPTKDTAKQSKPLAATHFLSSLGDGKATCSFPEALYQLETQRGGPKAQGHLQFNSAVQVQPATDTLRSPSEGPSRVLAPLSYSEAKSVDYVPEVGAEHTTFDKPISSTPIMDDPVSPKSPGALSRIEENFDGSWQAQLRCAANGLSYNGLSEVLPIGCRDSNLDSAKPPPESTSDEVSMRASSQLAVSLSEHQLYSNVDLPPLPFPYENDAVHDEKSEVSPAEAQMDEDLTTAAQLTYRPSKPPSFMDVEPANTRAEDHLAVPDLENSTTTAAIPKEDLVEDKLSSRFQDTVKDFGSTKPDPVPKAQPIYSRKRSKPTKKTESASETESDAPPKKEARNGAAKPRNSRAKQPSKAPGERMIKPAPAPAKTRPGADKSKKEATHMDDIAEKSGALNQHRSISKLDHFAYGKYIAPSPQTPIADESGDMILSTDAEINQPDHENGDADMEEHYSDVEIPVTPSKHAPIADNFPSTPRSRPKVSNRELQGLSPTKYRDRSSKSKRDTLPIARQLFASREPDALEDGCVTTSTLKLTKHPAAKPRATPAKAMMAKNSPVAPQVIKKSPAIRATKKQKVKAVEEEEYGLLFPPSKIDTKPPSPENKIPTPPRLSTRTRELTKSKSEIKANDEVKPSVKDNRTIEHTELNNEDLLSNTSELENGNGNSEDEKEEFKDAQETIEASTEYDETDNTSSDIPLTFSKNPKLKNKPLMLGGDQHVRQSKSPAKLPALSITSSIGTPTTNKYGFTIPRGARTRQAHKAATSTTAPPPTTSNPTPTPTPKVPAKRKASQSTTNTPLTAKQHEEGDPPSAAPKAPIRGKEKTSAAASESVKQPSVRKTRRASAREDEGRVAKEKEEERVEKEKVEAGVKTKLRRRG